MSLREMLESAVENFGTNDVITIMLSQRLDKQIVREQRLLITDVYKSTNNN